MLSVVLLVVVSPVYSKNKKADLSIGIPDKILLYPGEVETTDWAGVEHVLSPDVDENALYQNFSARNSAYVPLSIVVVDEQILTPAPVQSDTNSADAVTSAEEIISAPTDEQVIESDPLPEDEALPPEPTEEEPAPEAAAEPTAFKVATEAVLAFFTTVTDVLPFANTSTTTTGQVKESAPEPLRPAEPVVLSQPVEGSPETTPAAGTLELAEESQSEPVTEVLDPEPPPAVLAATTSSSTSDALDELLEEDSVDFSSATTASSSAEVTPLIDNREQFVLTLKDFATPELKPGEFITGVQLRVSLGAQVHTNAEAMPAFTIEYRSDTYSGEVGAILVDGETSNAINGGYYLFALPDIENVEEFESIEIVVRYRGSKEELDGAYLDALWLEVDTHQITRADLKERAEREIKALIQNPKAHELISTRFDFTRAENPVFNLKYISQRSRVTQVVRSIFGRSKVEVSEVEVKHRGSGLVGVTPEVNVTKDGLISISIPESERSKLVPGMYTVEIEVSEGSAKTSDSFTFQWGLLAINPDKTQYELGEVANLSMGALTPTGHTLCEANLRLFIIDSEEYIYQPDVKRSGFCDGNNVIDVPDYSALFTPVHAGWHEMQLEHLNEAGEVIAETTDTFEVIPRQTLSIQRVGPTRIFPPAPYPMELTVAAAESFRGQLVERVPADFDVYNTDADIRLVGDYKELTWDLTMLGSSTRSVSYTFDAPDISPFLYELGPASLVHTSARVQPTEPTASSSTSTNPVPENNQLAADFVEHRQWQIASDAVGNMVLFWDGGASIPTGWTCISCAPTDVAYERFVMGSSTASSTGGSATHIHTVTASVLTSSLATTESITGTAIDGVAHTHTLTPSVAAANNIPAYRSLQLIEYTAAAGEPANIPAGAIAIFNVASSSLPAGWLRYDAQDGYFVRTENTPGVASSSNTHVHAITGTTGAGANGTTRDSRSGQTQANAAVAGHTHTISASTAATTHQPPYVEVLLAKLTATSAPTNNIIGMWTDELPTGWVDMSSAASSTFGNRFIKASTTAGATGGSNTHTPADVTNAPTGGPSAITNGRIGTAGASDVHTHNVNFTNFSSGSSTPPYITMLFAMRQGTNPVYEQLSFRWYANEDAQTPTDPWPSGASDLDEGERITATSTELRSGDRIRLRINTAVTNATATAGSSYKLQYAANDVCTAVGVWSDVGNTSSSTLWRGYDNASVSDNSTLSSTLLASTTVAETYEENGFATSSPNDISPNAIGEWDFVLENNGAAAGTNYCFRMVESDGTAFTSYTTYPQLLTNSAPGAPIQSKLFDNEKLASTTGLAFRFVSTDPEADEVQYQIQIDNNYDFSSTLEDRNSISNAGQFSNLVDDSDKAPFFKSGELIRFAAASTFVNGTTYYWRVRAQDTTTTGSGEWSEWSTIRSFTIDTSLSASAWFQTEDEQFDTNGLVGVNTGGDSVDLNIGSTTGTLTSTAVTFTDGEIGTAWESFEFSDATTSSIISYTFEYLTDAAAWDVIPDADLPGNSSGFTSTPVNLLSLDVETYNVIRIVATLTNSGASPVLNDWTVNWGFLVETPTISRLFENEKVATTTPILEFITVDPQADSLTYQVSWSTDPTFAASTTRTSDVDPGFSNVSSTTDTDPFVSGDTIQFTIQAADALTNNTTYWWRVRAKDTTGDNAYSFWTEPRSFTASTSVVASTWFQTTQEQFDTNILSGTLALSSDVVAVATTASEAIIVYGQGTESAPRYRQWNGSVWGAESTMLDIGATLRWAKVKAATTREEYVAVTIGSDADINAQVFTLGAWGNLQEMTTNLGSNNSRGVDIAYETLSGDAMVAYCDNAADPRFYIWDGTSWTSTTTVINVAETTNCDWIKLASDPTSDEIIIMMRGTDGDPYEAQVWDGDAWGNSTTLGNIIDIAHKGMAVGYEEGGDAMAIASDGNPGRFEYKTLVGGTWSAALTQALGNDFEWGTLVSDIGSDELALCYQDENTNIGMVRWSGTAWSAFEELLTTTGKAKTDPGFSCVFEDGGSRDNYIMTAYTDTTQTNYSFWNNTTWSTGVQINAMGDTITSELQRTGTGEILGVFFDETNDSLLGSMWNGTTWSTTTTLENDASVGTTPYGRPFGIASRNSNTEGTAIAAPGINFSDGSGPYWQRMSWVDTTPGLSEILYSVQYYDGDSWEFIPDIDIPGNSVGTTTSPIDLSSLSVATYNLIRPYAQLTCDGSNNCPQLRDWTVEWAEGIDVSGTLQAYDQSTAINSGTIAVAVNGVLEVGKTGTVLPGGAWSIPNVTAFAGDVITVFVSDTADASEAVGITRYDGTGDITGLQLFERHVTLGSNDATSTPLTNADIALYDFSNDEDVFLQIVSGTLDLCVDAGCHDVELYINASTTYSAGSNLITHDIENNGILIATTTLYVDGSWDDNATSTLTGSTVVFSATSTTETVSQVGAFTPAFNNVTFGTTTAGATWNLTGMLDVNGNLTTAQGTLNRSTFNITVAGSVSNGTGGVWSGIGMTTFDGATGANWRDQNATLQNIGNVVIDGTNKVVTLNGNVAAQSVTIGVDDTLDVSGTNYDITVYGHWTNNNNFVPRNGEVIFAATTPSQFITTGGDSFFDLTFNGIGGDWSIVESNITVSNDLTIATGTLTLPTGTTTLGGSFSSAGGAFSNSNGTINFTSSAAETITASGTAFTNTFASLYFSGSGSWTMLDTNATATNDVTIAGGTVTLPSSLFAIGGSLADTGGAFVAGAGAVQFYSTLSETITAGGSSFNTVLVTGSGTFVISDASVTLFGDLITAAGTLTLPSGVTTIGGSLSNTATLNANSGQITFNSTDTGETIAPSSSSLYDVVFNSTTGGWTVTEHATATNSFVLTSASDWTLASGQTLSVSTLFTNSIGGASTTWTGSVLSLESGAYTINQKTDAGDSYETLRVAAGADIEMWNSVATSSAVDAAGSLYSQDHNAADGDLYIFGDYNQSSRNEYWSYATDFDGTDLSGGSERQADVRFAAGASASMSGVLFEALGTSTASTTVANQGSGTYTVSVSGGTTTAQYYDFADLGLTGLTLTGSTTATVLRDGSYTIAADGGTGITLSSTTIATTPGFQIYNITFATTTAISASNVTLLDGSTTTSYWWFRDGLGNLYGEAFDANDDNPGNIRFDDSALVVTLSGIVYQSDEVTPMGAPTCGAGTPVRVVVEGGSTYDGSCNSGDGSYIISGVTIVGDPTITVFLNGASGGERAVTVTKTITSDVTDLDLYENHVIVRHEDINPMTIADMAAYDAIDDAQIPFIAATGTPDMLTVFGNTELHVWATTTFSPGGDISLYANASGDLWDGTLHIANGATFTGAGTSTYIIGGSLDFDSGATFVPASTIIVMNATTTGKTIDTEGGETITLNELQFTGAGGGWNLNGNASATADVTVADGTLTGTGDLTLTTGSFSGNGLVSFGGGTVTIESSNTLGGTQGWTFNNLTLGSGAVVGTTTPASTATTTVGGVLTISNAHFLDAGSSQWLLIGSGTVFVETGTFLEDTSTITYGGTAAMNITATDYYNLTFDAPAGAPTFTATGPGIQVFGDMVVGGTSATTVTFDTNDTALNIDGDFTITSTGTFIASNSGVFTLAGSYDNNGVFTSSGGTIVLDGSGVHTIAAGASSFSSLTASGTGDFTFTESATSTGTFTIRAATDFTVAPNQTLAVGGTFSNLLGGSNTIWTDSVLSLYGGGNYEINASTTADSYGTLQVAAGTQIRMWNSDASTTTVATGGSLYSMDHTGSAGDLYIFGDYSKTSGTDYWSYATDFDGTNLTGSERQVSVYVENGGSITYSGGSLALLGGSTASTTVQNQGSGTYSFDITGGTFNAQYYVIQDTDAEGLTFTGAPTITALSNGEYIIGANSYRALTIAGSVINANPAKNISNVRFATTSGVATAYNASTTGSTVSSWRFTLHTGDVDGENFDLDNGNPGYIVWDDSLALITISGNVYENDESTVSNVCNGTSPVIVLAVAGVVVPAASSSCAVVDGAYSISNVSFSPNDTLTVFINSNGGADGVTVSIDPISSVGNMDIYEDHVIVRHEGIDPIVISDIAAYDSSDDADIPFTAVVGGTDTLTLDVDTKLIVWDNKTFEPQGNITTGGGVADALDGSVELRDNAVLTLANSESHSVGGNLEMGVDSVFSPAQSTVAFTSTGSGRTVDTNESGFYNVTFNGAGTFTVTDAALSVANDLLFTNGSVVLPAATTTISGSLTTTGGGFNANGGLMVFDSGAAETIVASTSDFSRLLFAGAGSWSMNDTNATATSILTITSGAVTLPSGAFSVGGSFENVGGSFAHNSGQVIIATSGVATILASSSDFYALTVTGGGSYTMVDTSLTLLDTLTVSSGNLTLASGTLSIGGSLDASGGTFNNASGTILFHSSDTGETINPGASSFNNVVFANGSGGWTVTANATTTGILSLATANSFTTNPGVTLAVGGVFTNSVGGAATTWTDSTLSLFSGTDFSLNSSTTAGDAYGEIILAPDMNISMWNSSAATTTLTDYTTSSLYSMDHAATDGFLYIYGSYVHSTGTQYWNYATDFDGTNLTGGSERNVDVFFVDSATSSFAMNGGVLQMVGAAGQISTAQALGSGNYSFAVTGGTINAFYYAFRDMDANGLSLSGVPTITSLSQGDFEVSVASGNGITLSSTTLNANASKIFSDIRFATTSGIAGTNVELVGSTSNAWRFQDTIGSIEGEDYDIDGVTACGSIRWDDSACLLVEQSHYRYRLDNGGLGVPASEWYDTDWNLRKSVRIKNDDATTYTDAVIELTVVYDSDMQPDFDDLRFTSSDGTTPLSYFVASTSNSVSAEVWVKVPSLAAEDTTVIYVYYNNAVATSNSSSTDTFIAADSFEDGDIAEYTGAGDDKSLFAVNGTRAYGSTYGLDNTGNTGARANEGGMARFDQPALEPGQTIRYMQYINTSGGADEVCTMFGVQTPYSATQHQNYAVCIEQTFTANYMSITKDVIDTDVFSGTTLASTTVSYTTGWHEIEIDWGTDDLIFVSLYDDNETLVATTSVTDSSYSLGGGYGFTYWVNNGGWDNFTARLTLANEPSVSFGAEVSDGGADWAGALDSPVSYDPNDVVRLRFAIENSGLAITNQTFDLEFATKGAAPSCEAVSSAAYSQVPNQASCGSSPICMQTTGSYSNNDATADLLMSTLGTFTAGEAIESPSNTTGNLNIAQDAFTEIEYTLTPTINATSTAYCLRVTDAGSELDTYLSVAELGIVFSPSISAWSLNGGLNISLSPGATTTIYATGTVSDLNGFADIVTATSTVYRSGVTETCTEDDNNCYRSSAPLCEFLNCAGNSCTLSCTADLYYFAEPTDIGTFAGETWRSFVEVIDQSGATSSAFAPSVDLWTMNGIALDESANTINYGTLEPLTDTGSYNATTTVQNIGNGAIDVSIDGTDLTDGGASTIAVSEQKFASTTFDYSACVFCTTLATTSTAIEVDLSKPVSTSTPVTTDVYWGIQIPFGTYAAPHQGLNTFYAVTD